jgi:hypothetical protein
MPICRKKCLNFDGRGFWQEKGGSDANFKRYSYINFFDVIVLLMMVFVFVARGRGWKGDREIRRKMKKLGSLRMFLKD